MSATETDFALLLRLCGMTAHDFKMERGRLAGMSEKEFQTRFLPEGIRDPNFKPCPNCACADHPDGQYDLDGEENDDGSTPDNVHRLPGGSAA